jgi:hypothetical protein
MRFALVIGMLLTAESGGQDLLIVPPYLDVMVLDIFGAPADPWVEVFPPGSTTALRPGIDGVERLGISQGMSTFTVPRPKAGVWMIRKTRPEARVRIVSQLFFPRGMLVEPSFQRTLVQHDRLTLVYRLLDSDGKALIEPPGYELTLSLSLIRPNGQADVLLMTRGNGAEFRSPPIALSLPGHYWTDVRVTTLDAQKRSLEVLRDRWSGFTVAAQTNDRRGGQGPPPSRWLRLGTLILLLMFGVLAFVAQSRRRRS